jgi:putative cell wall-binding protein
MRARSFRIRRSIAVAGAAVLAIGGVVLLTGGVASAAADGVTNLGTPTISPVSPPSVFTGGTNQPASSYIFSMPNYFQTGDTITFSVETSAAVANCTINATDFVGFSGTPTATAAANVEADPVPTFTTHLSETSGDPAACSGVTDTLTLTVGDNSTPSGGNADTFNVTLSGIDYTVGATASTGPVVVALSSETFTGTAGTFSAPPSNATVVQKVGASATGNSPAVTVNQGSGSTAVSNIVVTEGSVGTVTGSICVTPNTTTTSFVFSGTPTVSASPTGGTAGVPGAVTITVGGAIQVIITTPSSGSSPTTYTIAGVAVTPNSAVTGPASASVTTGGASCGADLSAVTPNVPIFDVGPATPTSISGTDIDATAAAELAHAFPSGTSNCPTTHDVILATDQNFPDALAASYLAQSLGTGILLTPTAGLSSETTQALRVEGIQTVYVVGGPLAISQTVLNELAATPAYSCGGGSTTGFDLTVQGPIEGPTQYDTAEDIALTPGLAGVGTADVSGAYGSMYNDTTGTASAAPATSTSLRTAIVVSGVNFPDASAASVMSYNDQFPVVLTDPNTLSTQTSATLTQLNIQQVIVVGGPLAVSDADVTAIEALNSGISVLRIAGQDQTDTAQELASFELNQNAGSVHTGLNWGTTGANGWANQILVARGDFYSDALAGCLLGHVQGGTSHFQPLVLTENPSTIGQYLTGFLSAGGSAVGIDGLNLVAGYSGSIQSIQALGGPLAVAFTTITAMAQAVATG